MNESKTPMTDAAINRAGPRGFVDVEFARDLERQLAEARAEVQRAWGAVNSKVSIIAIIGGNQEAALNSFHTEQKQRREAEAKCDQLAARVVELEKALQSAAESCPPKSFMTAPDCFTEKCGHNSYWRTHYGNCMACRAEEAESKAKALDEIVAIANTCKSPSLTTFKQWLHFQYPATEGDCRLNQILEAIEAAIAKEK